jgi:hypothetical protein
MGSREVDENAQAAPRGVTAADLYVEEEETFLVASQTAPVVIVTGDWIVWDTTTASLKSNRVKQCAATTDAIVGVSLETKTIAATAAAGDRHETLRIMRRGFHPAANVAAGAVGNVVTPTAVAGRGTGAAIGTAVNTAGGLMATAAAANLAGVWVNGPF